MNKKLILIKTEKYVRDKLKNEGSGHDWWHVHRVSNTALSIAKREGADLFIVELGALLHDIADYKFHGGDSTVGPRIASEWLLSLGADKDTLNHIKHIIQHVSFKGAAVKSRMKTLEGKIIQDADRLDAIGAIGIARAFTYGGFRKNQLLYDPSGTIKKHRSFSEYKRKSTASTIHHFYEKLLLLKDLMNTKTGKKLAQHRHAFMERYLKQFFEEWEGRK
ncbi:MAG: HD domain-containing protein [Deltaproteobacteria bacterium]|nr:HD domain-containing protein [Deltaproteobacteria bacterium]